MIDDRGRGGPDKPDNTQSDTRGDRLGGHADEGAHEALLLKSWHDGEAAVIQQLLGTYGIPCRVESDVPHSVLPLSVDGLGEIRILVPARRLEDARRLLVEHRRQGMHAVPGGKPRVPDDVDPTER